MKLLRSTVLLVAIVSTMASSAGYWQETRANGEPEPEASARQGRRCVHVTFVGDKSTSMESMGTAPSVGTRDLIQKIQQQVGPNTDIHLHFVCFNDEAHQVYDGDFSQMEQADIEKCVSSMEPSGMTRLFDTAVEALSHQQKAIDELRALHPDAGVEAVFALLTDGMDNRSHEHTAEQMRGLVEAHRASGATLMFFVAANQNAQETGQLLGFEPQRTLQLGSDEEHALGGFTALADTISKAAAGQAAAECVFTEDQRGFSVSVEERQQYDPDAVAPPAFQTRRQQARAALAAAERKLRLRASTS